ncbi:hypothetical protein, partial [Virgibacillus salexigens]|uniref:hypothetical protein n=1 Tax=Virgibacillus salexigens TaxID=61016 RepID=UPI001F16462D
MTKLFELVCRMYETGEIPSDFKKNVIIPIPKKAGADRCENYRTISLISHGCKILTRIIYMDGKAGRSRPRGRSVWVQEKCRNTGGNTHFTAYPR